MKRKTSFAHIPTLVFVFFSSLFSELEAQDYGIYYEEIKTAREHIVEGDYAAAVKAYQSCFNQFDFVFARDCIHALQIASKVGDTLNQCAFSIRALKQGVALSFLNNMDELTVFKGSDCWDGLQDMAGPILLEYQSSIDTILRKEIQEMFRQDQEIRAAYYRHFFRRIRIAKKWEELNANQVARIIQICAEKGFPGERLIGLDTEQFHEKLSANNLSSGAAVLLFIHHFSQPNPSFYEPLVEEVKKGNLYNEQLASICDFEAKFGKEKFCNRGYYGQQFLPEKGSRSEINVRRERLGLASVELMEKLFKTRLLIPFWKRLY